MIFLRIEKCIQNLCFAEATMRCCLVVRKFILRNKYICDCCLFASLGNFTAAQDYTLLRMLTVTQPNYSGIILIVRRFTVVRRRSVVVRLRVWHVWRRVLPILRRGAGRRHAIPVPLVAIHCKQQLHWTTPSQPPKISTPCAKPIFL